MIWPLKNSIKPALLKTGHAFDAFFFFDKGNLFLFPYNGIGRAAPEAKTAFGADIGLDFKSQ